MIPTNSRAQNARILHSVDVTVNSRASRGKTINPMADRIDMAPPIIYLIRLTDCLSPEFSASWRAAQDELVAAQYIIKGRDFFGAEDDFAVG